MNFKEELFKSIQTMIDRSIATYKCDRTYKSVVKKVTPKGYVVLDESGCERTVLSSIMTELKEGQHVWVKEPMGNIKELHICGIVKKTGR